MKSASCVLSRGKGTASGSASGGGTERTESREEGVAVGELSS